MTTEAAPKHMHDVLDAVYPLLAHARRIGMGGQIVLSIDKHGNLGEPKVNLSGVAKNDAGAKLTP